jgi:hypothetical protein
MKSPGRNAEKSREINAEAERRTTHILGARDTMMYIFTVMGTTEVQYAYPRQAVL